MANDETPAVTEASLKKLKVTELREKLAEEALETKGVKDELVKRLLEHFDSKKTTEATGAAPAAAPATEAAEAAEVAPAAEAPKAAEAPAAAGADADAGAAAPAGASGLSEQDKAKARAERFGIPEKKQAAAAAGAGGAGGDKKKEQPKRKGGIIGGLGDVHRK